MGRFGKTVLLGGLALTLPASAMAVDIPQPPNFYYPPPPPPMEQPGEFYLRLDLGYKIYVPPAATFDYPALGYDVPGDGEFINETLSNTWLAGFGVGWDPAGPFRTDLTLDFEWWADFEGELLCPSPCTADPDPEYSTETAEIAAWTLLVNGYIDFENDSVVTPYVGGGIGLSRLTTRNVAFVNPDGSSGTWTGATTWNLAWALTGGVGIEVAENAVLDINYRYVHLGDAMAMTSLGGGIPIYYSNIAAHEARVGLRFTPW